MPEDTTSVVGAAAELCWGYASAASLGAWSVVGRPGAWIFAAEIARSDSFRIAQSPLTIVTPNGWRWRVLSMEVSARTLRAQIEPIEPG